MQSPGKKGRSNEMCKAVLFTPLWLSVNISTFTQRTELMPQTPHSAERHLQWCFIYVLFVCFTERYEESSSLSYSQQGSKIKKLRKQNITYEKVAGMQILVSKSEGVQLSHCLEDHLQRIFVIYWLF